MTKAFRVCLHTLHFFFCSPTLHSRSSIFTQNHRKVQDGAAKAAGQAGKPIQAHHSEGGCELAKKQLLAKKCWLTVDFANT